MVVSVMVPGGCRSGLPWIPSHSLEACVAPPYLRHLPQAHLLVMNLRRKAILKTSQVAGDQNYSIFLSPHVRNDNGQGKSLAPSPHPNDETLNAETG